MAHGHLADAGPGRRIAQPSEKLWSSSSGQAGILGFRELESDLRRVVLRDLGGALVLEQSRRVDLGLLDGRAHGFQALVGERGAPRPRAVPRLPRAPRGRRRTIREAAAREALLEQSGRGRLREDMRASRARLADDRVDVGLLHARRGRGATPLPWPSAASRARLVEKCDHERVSCSCPSGVGCRRAPARSGSDRSRCARSVNRRSVLTRPIKLTGAVTAFSATLRSVLQISSSRSEARIVDTSADAEASRRMSPWRSFMSESDHAERQDRSAPAPRRGRRREASCKRLSEDVGLACRSLPSIRHWMFVVSDPLRASHATRSADTDSSAARRTRAARPVDRVGADR